MFSSVFSVTRHTDDVILSLSNSLYHVIDSSLDTLANFTVKLQILLPYFAAIPVQVSSRKYWYSIDMRLLKTLTSCFSLIRDNQLIEIVLLENVHSKYNTLVFISKVGGKLAGLYLKNMIS